MKVTKPVVGAPCYCELSTSDPSDAARFYGALFGWQVRTDPRAEAGGYAMVHRGEDVVAGMSPSYGEGQRPAWTMSVGVADIDAEVAAALQAGGTVLVEAMDVFDYGRFAVLTDPGGAVFSLWQAHTFAGASVLDEDGAMVWVELATRDPKAAVDFYTTVFGWTAATHPMGEDVYTQWGRDGADFGGMTQMGERYPPQTPAHWLIYFGVADVDAAVAKAGKLGGSVITPATDIPGTGRIAVLSDPQDAVFAVYSRER